MTPNEKALLAHFVSNTDRNVFTLKNLPEEVAAVLFARYSRSSVGLREDLLQLLKEDDLEAAASHASEDMDLEAAQEKARAFHEKYVVGYGHASVAEHAVVKLGIENVSILASKLIEDARLASYTEKSTRYVPFDPSKACYPENVMASDVAGVYQETIHSLMDAYTGWMDEVIAKIKERVPKTEKQTPRGYEAACRSTACDILRYILPTATHTNIGCTFNARTLETLISKLLSQPLPEGQRLGEEIKREAATMVPTLIKYAERNEYRAERPVLSPCANVIHANCARILPPFLDEADALAVIALPGSIAEFSLHRMLEGRGKHDPAPRELERVNLTFEIVMDFGAFRDVQRHRMATLITEPLSPSYGYEIRREIEVFGLADPYRALMDKAAAAYGVLAERGFTAEAPYALPLAYRVRTLFSANLRELFHFIELRSSRQGHPSYRNIAQQVYYEVERVYPQIARFIRVNKNEYALTRD
jgi:thymidylate synthase ThyX